MLSFARAHPVVTAIAVLIVAAAAYVVLSLAMSGGTDFDPVMR